MWVKLLLVVMCCLQVKCKDKEREALLGIKDDMDNLEESADEANAIIDILRLDIGDLIDNVTMSTEEDVEETETKEKTEDVDNENAQLNRIIAHLERVETKLKSLKSYFAEEKAVDQFLDSLDAKLTIDFQYVGDNVDQQSTETKLDLDLQLDSVRSSLKSVDTLARSRNVEVAGVLYHGGIGSPCLSESVECRVQNSSCYGGQCQCDAGLSYDALLQECVFECRNYGDTFQTTPNYILRDFNTAVLNETSLQECKEECRKSTTFTCRSVEYFPRWSTCFMSDIIISNETDFWWETNAAGNHYQRDCAYF